MPLLIVMSSVGTDVELKGDGAVGVAANWPGPCALGRVAEATSALKCGIQQWQGRHDWGQPLGLRPQGLQHALNHVSVFRVTFASGSVGAEILSRSSGWSSN